MDRPAKENPQSADILAEEAELGGTGVAALPTRLGRYAVAHQRALQMADYALQQGEKKLSDKLRHCGHWLVFRNYYTIDTVLLHAADFCKKHLLCNFCAIRRGAKYLKAYLNKLHTVMPEHPGIKAYMVTLTVKDGPDLWERFRHLRGAMKRMTQARRLYLHAPDKRPHVEFAKALGGVHSIENKRGAGSGLHHPHTHMVWLCHEAPDAEKLSREWHDWTGDSYIVDVRPFHDQDDLVRGFMEVFKYAVKFSEMPPEDTWEAYKLLSGKRLVDSFGILRGVEVSEDLSDDAVGDDLPYIEMFYRFMQGGYSLRKSVLVDDPAPTPAKLPKAPAAAPVPGSKSYTHQDFAVAAAAHAARVRSDRARAAGPS